MRKMALVVGLLALLLCLGAVPAFASGDDLLGSGFVVPENGEKVAPPVHTVTDTSQAAAGEALAVTGLDSGTMLLVGAGLVLAGGAAVVTSRRRTQ